MQKIIKSAQPILDMFRNDDIYIVGGTVRDSVLNTEPKDLDFAINLGPEQVQKRLNAAGYETWKIDKEPPTIGTKLGSKRVEVSTFRGTNIEEDLLRRDFTINAMAIRDNKIIDPHNGLKDISKQLVRCTKSPLDRFSEDPLRMLRAIRFVSTLGFRLDEKTKSSIMTYAHSILVTAKGRWFDELTKLLVGNNVKPALELLFKTRLLGYLLPEIYPITMVPRNQNSHTKDLWYHTKIVVNKSKPIPRIRWAALLHDMAKPQTMLESSSGTHFFQHEYLGSEMADGVLKRLKAGSSFRQSVRGLVALHQRIGDVVSRRNNPPVSMNALRRLARDCDERRCKIEDLVELFAADCSSGRKDVVERQRVHANLLRKALKDMKAEDLRPKLPKGIGERLMRHFNLKPGPKVGKLKQKLDSMLVSGKIKSNMTPEQMFKILEE